MKSFLSALFIALLAGRGAHASAWQGHSDESLPTQLVEYLRQSQTSQDMALRYLIERRCTAYLNVGVRDPKEQHLRFKDCQWMSRNLIRFLDSRLFTFPHPLSHKPETLPAVFVTDLVQLARDPRAAYFIKAFTQKSDMAASGLADLDPFALALQITGHRDEALRFMAVLFQDTSPAKTHVQWLRQNSTPDQASFIDDLDRAMDRWAEIESGSFRLQRAFVRFPSELTELNQIRRNRAYHFYVPAYLSSLLLKKSSISSPRTALLGPFYMNYLYECIHEGNALMNGFREPDRFDAESAGDVVMGYEGAAWATGLHTKLLATGERFREQLMESPINTLVRLSIELNSQNLPMSVTPPPAASNSGDDEE